MKIDVIFQSKTSISENPIACVRIVIWIWRHKRSCYYRSITNRSKYKDIQWSTNTFPIEYHNTQDVKSNPIIFDRISTHNVKSQERLFIVGKLPSNIDVTNITYEVYTTQNTNMAHITHALRFYCDSRNYIYSSEIDVKTIQNLKDIRYLPSCPSIVDTIEDFTNKHKTNSNMCHIRETQNITDTTDCLVVGAGITGLLVAEN